MARHALKFMPTVLSAITLLACSCSHANTTVNTLPPFVVPGSLIVTPYDGIHDDLLTGGLGTTGLAAPGR